MSVMVETIDIPDSGFVNIELSLTTNIRIRAKQAQQMVAVFVGNHIADLLHGDAPDLVLGKEGVYWRVPVILSSSSMGRIGRVGAIDVDVQTGDLNVPPNLLEEIRHNAQRFAIGAAL